MKRRVVITGMGAVSPLGNDVTSLWAGVKRGECGISEITRFHYDGQRAKFAGEAVHFQEEDYFDKKVCRRMDRVTKFGVVAAREAIQDSNLQLDELDKTRCGVIVSSGIGGLETIEKEHTTGMTKGFHRISPFFIPMSITNITAGSIAIETGFQGSCHCIVTACASATDSIGMAFRRIRDGYQEVMLAGGSEASITELGIGGFSAMKALSFADDITRASIPFDRERNGFVMGEGSGILVLEEYEHAKRRNAKIYAEIVGYGTTCDAFHITAPSADGEGAARCMQLALDDGNISFEQIDYINAHGTSTPLNDVGETKAIKQVFQERAYDLMISSTKSMVGHLLGASGGVESIVTALSLHEGYVTPTIHYREKDSECDLDIVPNVGREKDIQFALSNSLGFGGHNATLLFKKYAE